METSHKIKFEDLRRLRDGVIKSGASLWRITSINENEFMARSGRNTFRGFTKYLHPYSKGVIKQYDGMKPFFEYRDGILRKDTPNHIKNGTDHNDMDYETRKGLESANLTNHIIQDQKSKEGGYVIHDFGSEVLVKLRSGKTKRYDKSHLHFVRITPTRKHGKRVWLRHDPSRVLMTQKPELETKGDPWKEYQELYAKFDPDYQRYGYKRYKYYNDIRQQLSKLWEQLTDRQKEKAKKNSKKSKK